MFVQMIRSDTCLCREKLRFVRHVDIAVFRLEIETKLLPALTYATSMFLSHLVC